MAGAQLAEGFVVFVGLTVGEIPFVGVAGDAGVEVDSPPEIGIWATADVCVGVETKLVSLNSGFGEGNSAAANPVEDNSVEGDAPKAGKSATSITCAAGVSRIGGALALDIIDTAPTPTRIKAVNMPTRFNNATNFSYVTRTGFS